MSTRSSAKRLLSTIEDPERLLSRRNRSEPSLLFDLEEDDMAGKAPPQGPIPDLRPMEELLQAPTDGVGDAIVVPPILANQFELKIGLLNLVTAIAFHGFENDDPHSHIRRFTKITQTIDTFYNSLNQSEQDSLNSAAGGNFLTKNTQEALTVIENKSKVQTFRNKPQVASASGSSTQDAHITSLTKQVEALLSLHRPVNYVHNGCETCGGPHANYDCQAADGYTQEGVYATMGTYNQGGNSYQSQAKFNSLATSVSRMEKSLQERPQGVLPSNTIPNPQEYLKAITTRSGVTFAGPSIPPPPLSCSKEMEREPETTMDQVLTESTTRVPPLAIQPSPASTSSELPSSPCFFSCYSFLQMFKKLYININLAEALAHMPKFAKMVKDLLTNKEKLLELANTPLNENCSAVLLKKLPEKLGDTGRFLIPCDFYGLESCMALADLGASINLMPLSVWKTLSLPKHTPTRMTLELATRTVAYPAGIAKDVFVQVGKFTFPADFAVVEYDVDPRVPLILGRPFLRMTHDLVDVHGEELTLRVGDEKLVFVEYL
ncbi:reverse transcriptase domain-containing protein [Tanacetum coccineum]